MLFKNVASQKIHVYAYDSTTGAAKTGDAANITAYVSLDGTANAIDDTNPTEVDATNMPGVYVFDLAQAETNCNSFALYAKSSTSNIRIEPIIGFTTGAAVTQTGDCYARLGAPAGASHAADVAAVKGDTAAVKAKTDNLPTDPADQSAVEAAITAATSGLATAANLATVAGYIDTEITTILGYVDCLPATWVTVPTAAQVSTQVASDLAAAHGAGSWATATSVTVSDKTGFKLASDGLDSVATTAPAGPAANFREMIVQTWRRWFKRATRTYSGGTQQIVTYADNGTTPITTQTISDDGTTETQGVAS